MNPTITRIIVGALALVTASLTVFGQDAPKAAFVSARADADGWVFDSLPLADHPLIVGSEDSFA